MQFVWRLIDSTFLGYFGRLQRLTDLICVVTSRYQARIVLKIALDENIAEYGRYFDAFGQILAVPASQLTRDLVSDVDVLIVRSVTKVGRALLDGTRVRFVGSATAGTDHVDLKYLRDAGIVFCNAPGSNAESVAEYVVASLLKLSAITGNSLAGMSIGVVGVGQTGSRVADRAAQLGMNVFAYDPPRKEADANGFASFEQVLNADVVSLHVPLTYDGKYPTWHMLDAADLSRIRPTSWLINVSRGAVVDGRALLELKRVALRQGRPAIQVVLDVWENEPSPDPDLIAAVQVASPHVAGYSYDGKVAGTAMIAAELRRWVNQEERKIIPTPNEDPFPIESLQVLHVEREMKQLSTREEFLDTLTAQMFDVMEDTRSMRALAELAPEEISIRFTEMRKQYRRRRSFRAFGVRRSDLPEDRFPGVGSVIEGALRCRVIGED